ncbi:hypothetical protein LAD72_02710 [Mycoplasma sp. 3385/17]|nr:hypothetical protein [Mycoplasma tauri]
MLIIAPLTSLCYLAIAKMHAAGLVSLNFLNKAGFFTAFLGFCYFFGYPGYWWYRRKRWLRNNR